MDSWKLWRKLLDSQKRPLLPISLCETSHFLRHLCILTFLRLHFLTRVCLAKKGYLLHNYTYPPMIGSVRHIGAQDSFAFEHTPQEKCSVPKPKGSEQTRYDAFPASWVCAAPDREPRGRTKGMVQKRQTTSAFIFRFACDITTEYLTTNHEIRTFGNASESKHVSSASSPSHAPLNCTSSQKSFHLLPLPTL